MKSKSTDKKNVIKLYSSVNFSDPVDSKEIKKWNEDSKLKALIHFIGEYNATDQPVIYFKASVTFDASVDNLGVVTKNNILVKDICFKNELNVSGSSLTDEYKYLYDISCSSADNISKSSGRSTCSSDLSLTDIIANGIEKNIITNIKAFMESDAFQITWALNVGTLSLDTTKYNDGTTFPNVKMTIKYKLIGNCSSHSKSSSKSSCKSSSSSSSSKPNKYVKILIMGFVALMVIMLLGKLLKNKNKDLNLYDNVYNTFNGYLTGEYETKEPVYGEPVYEEPVYEEPEYKKSE